MSLNFCKSSFFRFSNLQDKRLDELINYLLLCLGALICVLALSLGIEGENLQKLSSSKLEERFQTLLITKDVWFDAFRYKCIFTYLNEIRASPQGRVCCASSYDIDFFSLNLSIWKAFFTALSWSLKIKQCLILGSFHSQKQAIIQLVWLHS